jgi:large subunit ribosomal protein L5
LKVTLRGARMWDFMDKLFNSVLCRIRDFDGVSRKSFDGRGNYTLAFKEQTIFTEIEVEGIDRPRGMEISFVTTAGNDQEGRDLLGLLGMPFTKE